MLTLLDEWISIGVREGYFDSEWTVNFEILVGLGSWTTDSFVFPAPVIANTPYNLFFGKEELSTTNKLTGVINRIQITFSSYSDALPLETDDFFNPDASKFII